VSRTSREEQLEHIRRTYADYRHGRQALWNPANRGYARMVRDRDRALVALVRSSTAGGGRVLDLGAGTGDLYGSVREAGLEVEWLGIDLLSECVEQAQQRYPSAAWMEASSDRLPLPDASRDVVVASLLFSSLSDSELERGTAAEIARVLRAGGWLIWYDLRYDNPGNPAVHGIGRERITELFPGWHAELGTMTLLPPLARRLGLTTAVAYPLLERIEPLRTHAIGRLRRA
jgi:SAM-dependent methyltransferase